MAIREMLKIDEDLCNGCGLCVPACAEGAIQIVDGKARLIADNLCDGLGACLGDCPEGAITIEKRDADEFDEEAVDQHLEKARPKPAAARPLASAQGHAHGHGGGCPGSRVMQFSEQAPAEVSDSSSTEGTRPSALRQWPVQLHLVPPTAPYYQGADLLLAADCTAFALGDFHKDHLEGKSLAIACPKLDSNQESYLQKLVQMIDVAQINTLTVMIMQVPCCSGLAGMAREAASRAQRKVPIKQIVVGLEGQILSEDWV